MDSFFGVTPTLCWKFCVGSLIGNEVLNVISSFVNSVEEESWMFLFVFVLSCDCLCFVSLPDGATYCNVICYC